MQKQLWRVSLVGTLLVLLIVGVSHRIRAGSFEVCSYADETPETGGCRGCWVIQTSEGATDSTGMPWTLSLQGSCVKQSGDGVCQSVWSSSIPSPACYGETTTCGNETKYYLSSMQTAEPGPNCGLELPNTNTISQADAWLNANTNATAWNVVGVTNCTKSYWKVEDRTSNVNCSM